MAWGTSTGTVAAANAKTASASYTSGAITCPSGDVIFLSLTYDNSGANLPTVNALTKPGGETATWTQLAVHATSNNTSGASCRTELWAIKTTQTWTAFSPVATLSASVTAKASVGVVKSGGTVFARETTLQAGGTSTASVPTYTTAGNPPVTGDLVIGVAGFETGTTPTDDADTTNGSWSAGAKTASVGSTDATNVSTILQWKIITAGGNQTYNPTNTVVTDSGATCVALAPAASGLVSASRVHAESLVKPTPDIQVGRVGFETLFKWPNRQYGSAVSIKAAGTQQFHGTSNTGFSLATFDVPIYEGSLYVIALTFDNVTASTPTVTLPTPSNETATWTYVQVNSPQATAGGGVVGILAYIKTTVPWSYTSGFTMGTVTLSAGVVAKTAAAAILLGVDAVSPSWLSSGTAQSPGASNTPATTTATPTGTPRLGDFMLVSAHSEESPGVVTPTVPNSLGAVADTGGITNSNTSASLGYMIYDGTSSTDHWATTTQDGGVIILPLAYTGVHQAQTWNVAQRISGSLSEAWDVFQASTSRVDGTISEAWGVSQRVSGTISETWVVAQRVSGSTSEAWTVSQRASGSLSEAWAVAQRVSGSLSETWGIAQRVSGSTSESWAVAQRVSGSTSETWAVSQRISGSLGETWGTLQRVTGGTTSESWAVAQRLAGSTSEAWQLSQRISASLNETWNGLQRVSGTLSETWNTAARISGSLSEAWSVGARVAGASLSETWSIAARVSGSVSETWGTGARVAGSLSETWNLGGRAAASIAWSWDVQQRVAGSLAETWADRQRVSGSAGETWSIAARVSGSVSSTWGTGAHVAASTSYAWGVSVRVSGSVGTSWDAAARVAGSEAESWQVGQRASGSLVETWNGLTRVSGTLGETWGTGGRISSQLGTSWDVGAHVVASVAQQWSTLARTDSTEGFAWEVYEREFATIEETWSTDGHVVGELVETWSVEARARVAGELEESWETRVYRFYTLDGRVVQARLLGLWRDPDGYDPRQFALKGISADDGASLQPAPS